MVQGCGRWMYRHGGADLLIHPGAHGGLDYPLDQRPGSRRSTLSDGRREPSTALGTRTRAGARDPGGSERRCVADQRTVGPVGLMASDGTLIGCDTRWFSIVDAQARRTVPVHRIVPRN